MNLDILILRIKNSRVFPFYYCNIKLKSIQCRSPKAILMNLIKSLFVYLNECFSNLSRTLFDAQYYIILIGWRRFRYIFSSVFIATYRDPFSFFSHLDISVQSISTSRCLDVYLLSVRFIYLFAHSNGLPSWY